MEAAIINEKKRLRTCIVKSSLHVWKKKPKRRFIVLNYIGWINKKKVDE